MRYSTVYSIIDSIQESAIKKSKAKDSKENNKKEKAKETDAKEDIVMPYGEEIGLPIDKENCESVDVSCVSTPVSGFISQAEYENRKKMLQSFKDIGVVAESAKTVKSKAKVDASADKSDESEKKDKVIDEPSKDNKDNKKDKEDKVFKLRCPKCNSSAINIHNNGSIFHCVDCGYEWPVEDADDDGIDDDYEMRNGVRIPLTKEEKERRLREKEKDDNSNPQIDSMTGEKIIESYESLLDKVNDKLFDLSAVYDVDFDIHYTNDLRLEISIEDREYYFPTIYLVQKDVNSSVIIEYSDSPDDTLSGTKDNPLEYDSIEDAFNSIVSYIQLKRKEAYEKGL